MQVGLVKKLTLRPRELIDLERRIWHEQIEEVRAERKPCVICGRPANSIHHVICLKYWGTGDPRENGVPCCLSAGCYCHFGLLNKISSLWALLFLPERWLHGQAVYTEAKRTIMAVARKVWRDAGVEIWRAGSMPYSNEKVKKLLLITDKKG